jgi:hypothetical protein
MGGLFYNLSQGHKVRERKREEARRSESADHAIEAAEGRKEVNLAADIRIAKLMGRW